MKKENKDIIPFLEFYLGHKITSDDFVELPENNNRRTPDYYVEERDCLVEVKEIRDRKDLEIHAQWAIIVTKLQKAVDKNPLIKQVKGSYLVDTPYTFKTPTETKRFEEAAKNIIMAIRDNKKTIKVFRYDFTVTKVNDEGNHIVFGANGLGGSFDPAQTIFENIRDKVNTANSQLAYHYNKSTQKTRIVLLVNKYELLFWDWDLFKGTSYLYEELFTYKNIDEIWFQNILKDGSYKHRLIFRRTFFEQVETSNFIKYSSADLNLFADWFSALQAKGDEKKEKLFIALRHFLRNKEPYQIFKDIVPREEMARFGTWLIEKKRFKDAIWLIEKFINDPNPEKGDTRDENRPSLHDSILNKDKSREPTVITSVMGHLAWTVQSLALYKETIIKAYDFTNRVLRRTKNYYIVLEWLIPLIAISGRRFWLKEQLEKKYYDFKSLSFSILNKYSEYPALQRAIVHLFHYIKELTTDEAGLVLKKLDNAEEYETLLIYFALFRERHYTEDVYPENIRKYNSRPARKLLEVKIKDPSPLSQNTRSGIAWSFWKILSENEKEFNTISPWIDEFMKYPYETRLFHNFERVVEEWFDRKPEKCVVWYKTIISSIANYANKNQDRARNLWLTTETEHILSKIAKLYPSELGALVNQLYRIWVAGAYVGSPKGIFQTYKLIEEPSLREKTRKVFKVLYKKMKKLNPKIENTDF